MLPAILRRGDFGDLFDRFFTTDLTEFDTPKYFPRIDIHEDKENIYVEADLPGLTEKDVKIEIDENNVLTIGGERSSQKEVDKNGYYRLERHYGSFERRFNLGNGVDASKAKAEYKNGELKLTVPKKEEKKPKTIQIDVK